jgi:hypothetical protein
MSSTEALSADCILGIAMLTMLVSSTDMNMPTIRMHSGTTQALSFPAGVGAAAGGGAGRVAGGTAGAGGCGDAVVARGPGGAATCCPVVVEDTHRRYADR